jgi:AraC-like DNA-binding protein
MIILYIILLRTAAQKTPNIMQKQPKLEFFQAPVRLSGDFPFTAGDVQTQTDRPITRLHRHDILELGCCYEGAGIFMVGEKVMPFSGGDVIFISSKEPHLAQSVTGTVSKWRWIYCDAAKILCAAFGNSKMADFSRFRGSAFPNVISPQRSPDICRLIFELSGASDPGEPFMRERVTALLGLLAAALQKDFAGIPEPDGGETGSGVEALGRVHPAIDLMRRKHMERLRTGKLAALCRMSPTNFRRVFIKATGKPPLQYLNRIRVGMAMAELGRGEFNIGETAARCGFESLSSFNRQFKAQTGISPREWLRGKKSAGSQPDF